MTANGRAGRRRWAGWPRGASVYFTVQGTSEAQVTLTGLRVRVTERRAPLEGVHAVLAGGGDAAYRWVAADLDQQPPVLTEGVQDAFEESVPEFERRPIRFPYEVSVSDAETFEVFASAQTCDCSFVVDLDWSALGQTGTITLDDHGTPFRLTGTGNATIKCFTAGSAGEQCDPVQS